MSVVYLVCVNTMAVARCSCGQARACSVQWADGMLAAATAEQAKVLVAFNVWKEKEAARDFRVSMLCRSRCTVDLHALAVVVNS